MRRRMVILFLCAVLESGSAIASWYDDYDAGIAAVRNGQWSVVIQKMSAAIAGMPKENEHARTYDAIFINFHPYYYRGVAYLNTGKYEQAISDFEKTSSPGDMDLGTPVTLVQRAKSKLEASNTATAPAPVIDPALRQQAVAAINQAKARIAAAQQRYAQATQALTDALTRNASARSNDDLNAVIAYAENAASIADVAPALGGPVPQPTAIPTTNQSASTASWYDDYAAGIAAAREGQWAVVIRKMSAAIGGMPKENDRARAFGAIFINYHPYYYRGVAYLNTGKFKQAISDFQKTSGPGEINLGALDTLIERARSKP